MMRKCKYNLDKEIENILNNQTSGYFLKDVDIIIMRTSEYLRMHFFNDLSFTAKIKILFFKHNLTKQEGWRWVNWKGYGVFGYI